MTPDADKFERAELMRVAEKSFRMALDFPDIARWRSCSVMAGCAAVRMAAEGELFMAAQLEGIADEARRQMFSLIPKEK